MLFAFEKTPALKSVISQFHSYTEKANTAYSPSLTGKIQFLKHHTQLKAKIQPEPMMKVHTLIQSKMAQKLYATSSP